MGKSSMFHKSPTNHFPAIFGDTVEAIPPGCTDFAHPAPTTRPPQWRLEVGHIFVAKPWENHGKMVVSWDYEWFHTLW